MSTAQADLFGPVPGSLPAGMELAEDVVDASAEQALIAAIDAAGLAPFAFQGWLGKRLTASFGHGYDYARGVTTPAPPIPDWLLPLRRRLSDRVGLDPASFVQALVIRYDPGAGIGWHRDRPQFGHVLGLSLGHAADLRFRRQRMDGSFERMRVPLQPRGAYRLSGPARWEWQHAILPVTQPRWSVTFRTMRQA